MRCPSTTPRCRQSALAGKRPDARYGCSLSGWRLSCWYLKDLQTSHFHGARAGGLLHRSIQLCSLRTGNLKSNCNLVIRFVLKHHIGRFTWKSPYQALIKQAPARLQPEPMPKKLLSPFDHLQDILASRSRTHSGKFQAVPAGTELVKDIVASSCAAVAEAFVADGFRWAKSGLRFSRKVGPFTHIVSFRADGANTSGHYVAVTMYAQVKSSALKK